MIRENLKVKGGSIYYEARGNGVPVVLIHAGYLDRRMWDSQFDALSRTCHAIRYDVRGFGKSEAGNSTYSDAVDLKSVLDSLEVESAILVGVSNGGRIALDFAVEYPERTRALVLMNFGVSGYEPEGPEEESLLEGLQDTESRYVEALERGNYREAATIDVDTWTPLVEDKTREWLIAIATENVAKQAEYSEDFNSGKLQVSPEPPAFRRLENLKMPVLMILGDRDLPGQVQVVRRMHRLIPNSELIVIEGADHIASLSKKKEFDIVLSEFIRKMSG